MNKLFLSTLMVICSEFPCRAISYRTVVQKTVKATKKNLGITFASLGVGAVCGILGYIYYKKRYANRHFWQALDSDNSKGLLRAVSWGANVNRRSTEGSSRGWRNTNLYLGEWVPTLIKESSTDQTFKEQFSVSQFHPTPLHAAMCENKHCVVSDLPQTNNQIDTGLFDVRAYRDGVRTYDISHDWTPFILAVIRNRTHWVKIWGDQNLSLRDKPDSYDYTPLMYSVAYGSSDTFKYLLPYSDEASKGFALAIARTQLQSCDQNTNMGLATKLINWYQREKGIREEFIRELNTALPVPVQNSQHPQGSPSLLIG